MLPGSNRMRVREAGAPANGVAPCGPRCVLLLNVCSVPQPVCMPTSAAAYTASPAPGAGYAPLTLPSQDRARREGCGVRARSPWS